MSNHSSQQAAPDEGAASPRLQDVIRAAIMDHVHRYGHLPVDEVIPDAAVSVIAALREVCTIRTVEQLDALKHDIGPVSSGGFGGPIVRAANGWIYEADGDGAWAQPGTEASEASRFIELPALLLWHPDWATS